VPQFHEHLTRAEQNEKLALSLDTSSGISVDWAITMLFYAALHRVDAYLARKNMHPTSHKHRDDEIERNGSICDIYEDYRWLEDKSKGARYDIANFDKSRLEQAKERLKRIRAHLNRI